MSAHEPEQITQFPSASGADARARLADPDRLKALGQTGVMDSAPEEPFDRTVRLATAMLGVPVGLASFVDEERQYFKAQCGLSDVHGDLRETPLSHSFCQYVVAHDTTLAVSDARTHPLLHANLAIADLGVIAYLGVPIHAPTGETIGSFCAIDTKPRDRTQSDVALLTDLTAMLETELKLRHERDTMETLARELNHRVKNLFSIVGGMIAFTARSTDTSKEMAQILQGRLAALDVAHSLISPAIAKVETDRQSVGLRPLVEQLLAPHLSKGWGQVTLDLPDLAVVGRAVTDLSLVIHELATNAAKYGSLSLPDGHVDLTARLEGDILTLVWRETGGPAISAPPTERRFGSRLIETSVTQQMSGTLDTDWHPSGVEHALTLPQSLFVLPDGIGPATAE